MSGEPMAALETRDCPEGQTRNWYAVYTSANQERRVADQLLCRGIEFYLPLYRTVRRRSDRRVSLSLPLFPGYVFVRIPLSDRLCVLEVPRVVCLVGFPSRPLILPEQEIARLRRGLSGQVHVEPCRYLTSGCRVKIVNGPFGGAEGILLRAERGSRIVIALEPIGRAFRVEVDQYDVERL